MANTIALAKQYVPILDEVYAVSAKSSVLDAPAEIIKEGLNANEILLPKMTMQGLGNYSRSAGYVAGDVTLAWETHTFSQNRGRSFQIDEQDNLETAGVAFGRLAGEFVRTKVAPEVDAYRFATLAGKASSKVAANLSNTTAVQAFDTALETMENDEVSKEDMILFASPTMKKYIKQSDSFSRQFVVNVGNTAVNREIDTFDGVPVVWVPQPRFYSEITLYDGSTAGQEAGGYIKTAVTGKDINFLLVDLKTAMGIKKTDEPRIFDPLTNQSARAWKFDYNLYHDLFVPDNKVKGIYCHTKA